MVGWARRCEVVKRLGGTGGSVSEGGIARRRVVDVPSETIASPGVERDTIEAGLSPVNGATIHSVDHVKSTH